MFHRKHGGDVLLQGDHLEKLSPESHEQRAELSQVHVYQLRQLVGRLGLMLEKQKHFVISQSDHSSVRSQSNTPPKVFSTKVANAAHKHYLKDCHSWSQFLYRVALHAFPMHILYVQSRHKIDHPTNWLSGYVLQLHQLDLPNKNADFNNGIISS